LDFRRSQVLVLRNPLTVVEGPESLPLCKAPEKGHLLAVNVRSTLATTEKPLLPQQVSVNAKAGREREKRKATTAARQSEIDQIS
jgi:hypothetical protein